MLQFDLLTNRWNSVGAWRFTSLLRLSTIRVFPEIGHFTLRQEFSTVRSVNMVKCLMCTLVTVESMCDKC